MKLPVFGENGAWFGANGAAFGANGEADDPKAEPPIGDRLVCGISTGAPVDTPDWTPRVLDWALAVSMVDATPKMNAHRMTTH